MILLDESRLNRLVSSHDDVEAGVDPVGFVPVLPYINLDAKKQTWLLRNLLPAGGSMLIHAEPKAGKSAMAIQLALALSGSDAPTWMGFDVMTTGRVLYLQVDAPRAAWKERWKTVYELGYDVCNDRIRIADNISLDIPALDIALPDHVDYLRNYIEMVAADPLPPNATWENFPTAVIVDTLRDCSSSDENSPTEQSGILRHMKTATAPAATIIISHSRKKVKDGPTGVIASNRGTNAITGAVDTVCELTATHDRGRLSYVPRDAEQGFKRLEKVTRFRPNDTNRDHSLLMWKVADELPNDMITKVLQDKKLGGLREHGRALGAIYRANGIDRTDSAATMELRRFLERCPGLVPEGKKFLMRQ